MSLPLWTTHPESLTLTEERYDKLPDQTRKLIEVIDGHAIFCQSGIPERSDVGHRLAAVKSAEPCTRISTHIGVYFAKRKRADGGLSFRRPSAT